MKIVKYIVKIPIPDKEGEYEKLVFNKTNEVCERLQITITTMYGILKKTIKFKHGDKKYLEGIIIEKEIVASKNPRKPKKTSEEIEIEKKEYIKTVLKDSV